MINILVCVLIAIIILYVMTLFAEKIYEIVQEKDYKKAVSDYLEKLKEFVKLSEKISLMENEFNELSKRFKQFETDFKTYDEVLENRITDIEQVIQDWKDTMAGAVTCEHGCAECKSDDSKKSHPKTKPKAKSQPDIAK